MSILRARYQQRMSDDARRGTRQRRNTRQREIIRAVLASCGRPLGAHETAAAAQHVFPALGIATVYRALKEFVAEGWLVAIEVAGVTRYELADVGGRHHHHFHCGACERVFDVERCGVDLQRLAPSGFLVSDHELTLHGTCKACTEATDGTPAGAYDAVTSVGRSTLESSGLARSRPRRPSPPEAARPRRARARRSGRWDGALGGRLLVCALVGLGGSFAAASPSSAGGSSREAPEAGLSGTDTPPSLREPGAGGGAASTDPANAPVDAELAAAAAADTAARTPSPATSSGPSVPLLKLNPDMSIIMNGGFGWRSSPEHVVQGGHAIDANGFALQALELAASASVDPYFRLDLYFQMAHLHLEEALLTTLALPAGLQARAGYFNAAFGRQNPQHLHTWSFVNPPLSHSRFMAEEHFSGAGAEFSALLPLPWYSVLLVEALTPSAAAAFRSATFSSVEANASGRLDGPEDFVAIGRSESFFELSADWSVLAGVSAAFGQSPYVPDNRAALFGGDLYVKWRPLGSGGNVAVAFTLEGVLRDTQVPRDSVRDWGGYAQLDVSLSKRFVASARGDFTAVARGAVPSAVKMPSQQARGSWAFTFLPTHFSKLRLQIDVARPEPRAPATAAFFAQVEVNAGEHGAHRF